MEKVEIYEKLNKPGLWFVCSMSPTTEVIQYVYDFAVELRLPVVVYSSLSKRDIQNAVVNLIRKKYLDNVIDEKERDWLEQEMSEYNTHGFFFHPQEMNDYVENGPFWSEYVHFNDEEWLNFSCCPYDVVLIDDIHVLCDYEGEADLANTLPMVHADAIERNKTLVVYISEKTSSPIANFIETHLVL